MIGGDAAALFVGKIHDVETRVMDVVTRTNEIPLFNPRRRIRTQPAALRVEAVLQDNVGARIVLRRLQHVVLKAGDVRHNANRLDRSVAIACAPMAVSCLSIAVSPSLPSATIGYVAA